MSGRPRTLADTPQPVMYTEGKPAASISRADQAS